MSNPLGEQPMRSTRGKITRRTSLTNFAATGTTQCQHFRKRIAQKTAEKNIPWTMFLFRGERCPVFVQPPRAAGGGSLQPGGFFVVFAVPGLHQRLSTWRWALFKQSSLLRRRGRELVATRPHGRGSDPQCQVGRAVGATSPTPAKLGVDKAVGT